jgi:glucan phosphoethanolaminetransferase (alkaline phosphatase superfamily)
MRRERKIESLKRRLQRKSYPRLHASLILLLTGLTGFLVGLYKRVIEHRHWLRSALRRTALPAGLIVVFFTIAGFAMQKVAPEASSIGEFWKHVTGG